MNKEKMAVERAILGQVLREIRIERGLTQETVARAFGRGVKSISRIESGQRRLPYMEFFTLCDALGVDYGETVRRVEQRLREAK